MELRLTMRETALEWFNSLEDKQKVFDYFNGRTRLTGSEIEKYYNNFIKLNKQ